MKVKLSEVCNITMGQSPDSSSYNQKSDGIPFFQGNADFGTLYPTARTWTTSPKKIAQKDDILISVRAPIGALNYANIECCIGRGLASIKPLKSVYSKYIFYLLKSQKSNLDSQGVGSTFKAIGRKNLEEIEIENLDIETQQRIAHHLDTIQSAIDNKKQQLALLDEVVKSRFIELFGDPVLNSKKWEVKKLKDTTDIITGNTPSRKEKDNYGDFIEWIKTDNITDKTYITKATESLSEKGEKLGRTVEAGSILMACIAGSLKSIGRVALTDRKVAFNQQINAIVPKKYNNLFLYALFQNTQSYAQSTVNMALKGILSKGKLEELEYIVPPINLQNEFADFVQQIDKSKFVVKQQLADLQELLDSKMQEYFG